MKIFKKYHQKILKNKLFAMPEQLLEEPEEDNTAVDDKEVEMMMKQHLLKL
jgi:hypothetical protein